jgi:hypothetical protein
MRLAALLVVCLLSAAASDAQAIGGTADLKGEKVILLPDYTWRYDDSGGERCTSMRSDVALCALPSNWSPVPGDPGFDPLWFQQGTDFRATVWVLGGPSVGVAMTIDTVKRFINGDRGKDTDYGLTVEDTKAQLAGRKPSTLASVIGGSETRVYSFVDLPDGSVLLAVTVEDPSFSYSFSHKSAHASFLKSIQLGGKE